MMPYIYKRALTNFLSDCQQKHSPRCIAVETTPKMVRFWELRLLGGSVTRFVTLGFSYVGCLNVVDFSFACPDCLMMGRVLVVTEEDSHNLYPEALCMQTTM